MAWIELKALLVVSLVTYFETCLTWLRFQVKFESKYIHLKDNVSSSAPMSKYRFLIQYLVHK